MHLCNIAESRYQITQTIQPSNDMVTSYTVSPNLPRYLIVPKLNIDARIISVGTNSQGAISTPNNVFDTAWHNQSSLPGQSGAMVIDGHISSWTTKGVFYSLNTLEPGDIIKLERGDGVIYNYKVVKTQIYSSENIDMSRVLSPVNPGSPGLNLISCFGDVIAGTNEFNERIVVFTELI